VNKAFNVILSRKKNKSENVGFFNLLLFGDINDQKEISLDEYKQGIYKKLKSQTPMTIFNPYDKDGKKLDDKYAKIISSLPKNEIFDKNGKKLNGLYTKNDLTAGKLNDDSKKEIVSIENSDFSKNTRINSPRSLEAMKKLGIEQSELIKLSLTLIELNILFIVCLTANLSIG